MARILDWKPHLGTKDCVQIEQNLAITPLTALPWICKPNRLPNIHSSGDICHIWWSCTYIGPFWEQIIKHLKQALGVDLPAAPETLLLSMIPGPIKNSKKGFIRFALQAARVVIPLEIETTPSTGEWMKEIETMMGMEELISHTNGTQEQNITTWTAYIMYKETAEDKQDKTLEAL
ncbi:hypothetical protein XELAEV_18025890mg [Xenopus laevis]|uniref:Uncharacterized protein n=1 Tax=Xenopus laevis TaxID=8355 RepID=A0A974D379_XENLA|nr:hypothetical protein XELAEV_18025890mg [Xenopus laevis]